MAPTTTVETPSGPFPIAGRVHVAWCTGHRRQHPSTSALPVIASEMTVTDVDTGEPLIAIAALTIRCAVDEYDGLARVELTEYLDDQGRPVRGDAETTGESATRTYVLLPGIEEPTSPPDMDTATFGLDFGRALAALRAGRRVARFGWNGCGMWLVLVPGSLIRVEAGRPLGTAAPELLGCEVGYEPHIDIMTAQGTVVPWLASQTDVLAYDWQILETPAGGAA